MKRTTSKDSNSGSTTVPHDVLPTQLLEKYYFLFLSFRVTVHYSFKPAFAAPITTAPAVVATRAAPAATAAGPPAAATATAPPPITSSAVLP